MGIGKTLAGIVLMGAIGTGGYFIGKNAGQDKEYGIIRDEKGVYFEAKSAGKLYEIGTLDGQPYLKNQDINFYFNIGKTEYASDILKAYIEKASGSSIDKKTSNK